ncbi:MAG TPA: hypothetical protein VG477_03715 [Thermoanaerobaculia bacterium]|jgi:hypothetical protein|nr:hypothetical protein [Thermoanaerobaculia bacterium]
MQIHDFYSKFASTNEKCSLFQALRDISLIENLNHLFEGGLQLEWAPWPPMQSAAVLPAEA